MGAKKKASSTSLSATSSSLSSSCVRTVPCTLQETATWLSQRGDDEASTTAGPAAVWRLCAPHDRICVVGCASRRALAGCFGRASHWLEAGGAELLDDVPRSGGAAGGAANYTGHNMRWCELARFAKAVERARVGLLPGETKLLASLQEAGVLRRGKEGWEAATRRGEDGGIVAMARGLPPRELGATLLHEAMHGIFYTHRSFAAKCEEFYTGDAFIGDTQRAVWRRFLETMGYDSGCDDLAVNEFQAYMLTERDLFGHHHHHHQQGSGKSSSTRTSSSTGSSGGDDQRELSWMQVVFNRFIASYVPTPVPELISARCIFRDTV